MGAQTVLLSRVQCDGPQLLAVVAQVKSTEVDLMASVVQGPGSG